MDERPTRVEPHYTLKEAVQKFFPNGPLTPASLRNEIKKGRLQATMPAGKMLVTETAIAEMLTACRVGNHHVSTSKSEARLASPYGSSETERDASAQAAASAILNTRSKPSRLTSVTNTGHQKR
jgi:hypothetical protein